IPDIAGMIRELVDSQSAGFTGFIDELEFVEIVQFLSISSSDMQLEIETKDNKGTLDFRGGELVHAETSDKQGAEAFYDIFLWKGGQFNPNKLPADLEQTIFEPVEGLLLEAARLEDEKSVMLETEEKIDDVEELPADEAMSAELVEKPDLEVKPEISSDTPATSTSAAPVKRKKKDGSDQKIISIENVTEIVSPIVDSFMQYFPKNKDKITYNKLPLQKLPSIVQHFVVFRLNQISRSSIRFENTPFDSSNIRVSEAALNLVNILMETWKITPDYFRSILEEAVEFHLFRSIDPTNTITDFLFGLTEGDCWQIEENINSIVTEKVIEDFFRLGEIEFDCQNEAKVTLKELEKKISKKIEKADDDNKFDSFYQSVEWLLYFASFVPNSQIFSIEMELISIMSKNRELKGFTAYLKKQKYPPEHPVTLDEFYEYLEDFRS
ncbi:MAG: DUF4388 domain-containing protein, partial [Candidatus Electryonea clarkiae]|nr:DUF4388 domain-containing protein [Candidatus Electryonea clarkiae]